MTWLFEPGFFANAQVHQALLVGAVAAVVSAVVGTYTVLRGQAFAGHALTDAAATGGSGATLVAVSPLAGFAAGALAAAGAMHVAGGRQGRRRDLATGVVLGAFIGLASLFLYLDTTTSTAGATQQVLFGSVFAVPSSTAPLAGGLGAVSVAILAAVHRPLLLSSIDPDMAAAAGVRVRLTGLAYLVALALAVALSSLATGAILSTALLIGPSAIAVRFATRYGAAVAGAAGTGLVATWLGVLLAYDSADWLPGVNGLPVSFFIVALVFTAYLAAMLLGAVAGRRHTARRRDAAAPARR
jgi:zinc/manganese transport system permease protein